MDRSGRDFYFDNAKLILIFLVLIGHFIEPVIDKKNVFRTLFLLIYSFHIPAFVLISGYFTKSTRGFFTTLKQIIIKLLIPYIVFQTLYSVFDSFFAKGTGITVNFVNPYWIMWFLLCLIYWRLVVSLFRFQKRLLILFIALVISIMSGYIDQIGHHLSLSRAIVFFPYFLLGYFLEKGHFNTLVFFCSKKIKLMITIIIFLMEAGIFYYVRAIQPQWFYGSLSYLQLGYSGWAAGGYRLILFLLTIFNLLLFFWIIPAGKTFYSILGRKTIYPFILHGFIVKGLVFSGFYSHINSSFTLFYLISFALGTLLLLNSRYLQKGFKILVEPGSFDI